MASRALVLGVYRVLAWVVSVMLPPMAISFLFVYVTGGFRISSQVAFNLDHYFKRPILAESKRLPCVWDLAAMRQVW